MRNSDSDILKAGISGVIGMITISSLQNVVGLVTGLVTLGYITTKWIRELRKFKQSKIDDSNPTI